MPSPRHEELKNFAVRMLNYMGITEIYNEYTYDFELFDGSQKRYRIDMVGIKNNDYNLKDQERMILFEIGHNRNDKVANLRMSGYNVFLIPFSENGNEFQEENALIRDIVETNKKSSKRLYELVSVWNKIGDSKISEIKDYHFKIEKMYSDFNILMMNFQTIEKNMESMKELFTNMRIEKIKK